MSTTATTSATTMPSSTNIMAKSNTTIGITAMVNVDNEDTLLTSSEAKSQQSPSVNEVCNTLAFTNNQSNEDKMSQTNLVISNTTNLNHKDHTNHDNTKLYPKLYEKLTNTTTSNTNLTKSPSPPPIRVLTPSEIMQTLPPSLCRNEVPTQPNLKNTDTDSTIASVVVVRLLSIFLLWECFCSHFLLLDIYATMCEYFASSSQKKFQKLFRIRKQKRLVACIL